MIGMEHIGITEEQLNALGKAWTKKAGETRWYVNGWQALIGMEVQYHRSGNVSDVFWTVDGERKNPSNSWYSKYVASTKVWLDAQGRVHVDRCESRCVEEAVVEALDRIVERMVAPAQETSIEAVPEEAVGSMVAWTVYEVEAKAEAQAPVEEAEVPEEADVDEPRDDAQEELRELARAYRNLVRKDEERHTLMIRYRGESCSSVIEYDDVESLKAGYEEEVARAVALGSDIAWIAACAAEPDDRGHNRTVWEARVTGADIQALREQREAQAEPEQVAVFVEREDGQQAKVMVPDVGEDVWTCILKAYPTAYDLIGEGRILVDDGAGYGYDASFVPGEDEALAQWLAEGVQHYSGGLDGSDATIEADRREGVATVTWAADGLVLSQDIDLGEGDMERIVLGADPVAEGWEDGLGRVVCRENASGDVPEGMWADVMAAASWEPWDQGDSCDEQVQLGTWRGRRVEAVYRIPDPEAFEEALREDEDGAYLDSLKSLRVVGWSE